MPIRSEGSFRQCFSTLLSQENEFLRRAFELFILFFNPSAKTLKRNFERICISYFANFFFSSSYRDRKKEINKKKKYDDLFIAISLNLHATRRRSDVNKLFQGDAT